MRFQLPLHKEGMTGVFSPPFCLSFVFLTLGGGQSTLGPSKYGTRWHKRGAGNNILQVR